MFKFFCGLTVVALACGSVAASEFNEAQKNEIEVIASEYIASHPEIIMQAMQKLQQEQQNELERSVKEIGEFYRHDKATPSIGDDQRKHYLIEFFDYNCGYCKVMEPAISYLLKDDHVSLQVVYVNIPVITKTSAMSATVAQALFNLDKEIFFKFHEALMHDEVDANSLDAMEQKIGELGMDWDKVLKEMQSRRPQDKLSKDLERSRKLHITGTPYLIIDGKEFRGAIRSESDLRKLIGD